MTPADIDRVMEIAACLKEAPHWPRSAYLAALEPKAALRRVALVVESPAGAKAQHSFNDICGTTKVVPCYKAALLSKLPVTDAEQDSIEVAGFAVASLLPPEAELEMIAVDPAAQRHGLASQLLAKLNQELRSMQMKELMLEVRASNHPALALYRNLGFIESGRRKDYYQIPVEDALLMRLGL
jgi:ribosomal-protein-alanine N-acetyltransferase